MSQSVQLNARMEQDLKASGDAALSLIGFSPTQAVRALWTKAARRGEDLEQVAKLLSSETSEAKHSSCIEGDNAVRKGWELMDAAYERLGIDASTVRDFESDDDMLESALHERLVERGLA